MNGTPFGPRFRRRSLDRELGDRPHARPVLVGAGRSADRPCSNKSSPAWISSEQYIDAFIATYNQTARPFAWSKSEVHQKQLKPRSRDL